jgi:hypothetical protein
MKPRQPLKISAGANSGRAREIAATLEDESLFIAIKASPIQRGFFISVRSFYERSACTA